MHRGESTRGETEQKTKRHNSWPLVRKARFPRFSGGAAEILLTLNPAVYPLEQCNSSTYSSTSAEYQDRGASRL